MLCCCAVSLFFHSAGQGLFQARERERKGKIINGLLCTKENKDVFTSLFCVVFLFRHPQKRKNDYRIKGLFIFHCNKSRWTQTSSWIRLRRACVCNKKQDDWILISLRRKKTWILWWAPVNPMTITFQEGRAKERERSKSQFTFTGVGVNPSTKKYTDA